MSLFTGSLEKRNRKYLKDVKLQDLNNQYQKAQNDIIRDALLKGLSQAETKNKLEDLQNTLREQSGATELVKQAKLTKQEQEQKPSISKERYHKITEDALQRNFNTIGQLLPDFPAVPPTIEDIRPQRVKDILNLYSDEPKKQATGLMAEVIAVALNKAKKRDLNKTELNNAIQKNLNAVANNPDINKKLVNELEDAIRNINLRKTTPVVKVKTKSPFQQELEKKIAQQKEAGLVKKNISSGKFVPSIEELKRKPRIGMTQTDKSPFMDEKMKAEFQADLRDRDLTRFAKKSIIPSSSQATTASTTSIFDEMPESEYKTHISKYSSDFRKEYEAKTGKKYPYMGNIGYNSMRRLRAQWGQGLRKKRK